MPEYALAPLEQPEWVLEPHELAVQIRARWPAARVAVDADPNAPMVLHALIPFTSPKRELGVAMVRTGDYLSLESADPDMAAEFAAWLVRLIPDGGPTLHILPKDRWDPMPVELGAPAAAISDHLVRI
jgi:hypothetical protein